MVGHSRNLRGVGHTQHLHIFGHLMQLLPHLAGGASADPGIHLVENHGVHRVVTGQHRLQGQHNPGQFAPRRNF